MEINFAHKKYLHVICIVLLVQELSSPFTNIKGKPDGQVIVLPLQPPISAPCVVP